MTSPIYDPAASTPLVSFIILSYNYEKLIGQTIQSILDQTMTDFEVIIIDDCSKDNSVEVIRSFTDKRIHLYVNDVNLGGPGSFNRAFSLCRGKYISCVDSDDWIHPQKTELQLKAMEGKPGTQISATWVDFRDIDGNRHKDAETIETSGNLNWDYDNVETWVLQNNLCRSSSIVTREFHETYGLGTPGMHRAGDFELWTRALRAGVGFVLVPQKLTYYRLHASGVTHADPKSTFFEFAYIAAVNLMPIVRKLGRYDLMLRMFRWVRDNPHFSELKPWQRYRLFAKLAGAPMPDGSYEAYLADLVSDNRNPREEAVGMSLLSLDFYHPASERAATLAYNVRLCVDSIETWVAEANYWQSEYARAAGVYQDLLGVAPPALTFLPTMPFVAESELEETYQKEAMKWQAVSHYAAQQNALLISELNHTLDLLAEQNGQAPVSQTLVNAPSKRVSAWQELYSDARNRGRPMPVAFASAAIHSLRRTIGAKPAA